MATVSTETASSNSDDASPTPTGKTAGRRPESTEAKQARRKWRKTITSIILVAASLILGAGTFLGLASLKEDPPRRTVSERTYNVETFIVESATVREIITAFGTATADRQVTISAEVGGLVMEVHPNLEVGVQMKPPTGVGGGGETPSGLTDGDELLKIDQSTYQKRIDALDRQIAQLKVQRDQLGIEKENNERLLVSQQANLNSATEELNSAKQLRASGAGNASLVRSTEQQVNQYQSEVVRLKNAIGLIPSRIEAADAQIAAAEAELETAKLDLKRTSIFPPFPGTVSQVRVEQGQYVRPGDPLVVLTDLDRIEVPVALTQTQFAHLGPLLEQDEPPTVQLAESETAKPRWQGRLVRVSPVADEVTRTVDVFVEVDNRLQDTPLLPGTFVHVRIAGPPMSDTLIIPRDVVTQGFVYVVRERSAAAAAETPSAENPTDSPSSSDVAADQPATQPTGPLREARQVNVEIDRNIQSFAVIKSGVKPGDQVVMTNLDVVHDGALLAPQSRVSLDEELAKQRIKRLESVRSE